MKKTEIFAITIIGLFAITSTASAFAQSASDPVTTDDNTSASCDMLSSMLAEDAAPITGTVSIGALHPLSGDLSSIGGELRVATELAVEDFNSCLEMNDAGWNLELIVEDTMTTPTVALEKVTSLYAKGVDLIVGPATSGNAKNSLGYANANDILLVSCCSTAPSLSIENDNLFRIVPNDANQGIAISKLLQHEGIQAIVPIWRGDAYGDDLHNVVEADFADRGGILYPGIRYNPGTLEFGLETNLLSTHVTEAINEYGTENVAVVIISFDKDGVAIMQSASNYQVLKDVRWFSSEALSENIALIDDPIVSEFADTINLQSVQFVVSPGDVNGDVKKRITDAVGHTPISFVYPAYDAVWLIGLSAEKANSADAAAVKSVIHEVAAEYSGAMASTALDKYGDLTSADYQVWTLQNNEWMKLGMYVINYDIITSVDQPTGEVQVASLYPITGSNAATGFATREATDLGAEDFNRFLQSIGEEWHLTVIAEDSTSFPATALDRTQTLFSRGIDIIIGPRPSGEVRHVMGYANTNDMMLVSCCSTAPDLAVPNDAVFRIAVDDVHQGAGVSKLFEHQGITAVVPIWLGDAYGDGLIEQVTIRAESNGYIVGDGARYDPTRNIDFAVSVADLADQVQKQVDEHGKDKVAVFIVAFDESIPIMQAAERFDILNEVRWFGAETFVQKTNIFDDRIANELVHSTEFTAMITAKADNSIERHVTNYFLDKHGEVPTSYIYSAYDIAWLVGLSMLQSGATDAGTIKTVFHDVANGYVGANGNAMLNEAGDLTPRDYAVWTVSDGQWVLTDMRYSPIDDAISTVDSAAGGQ